MKKLSLFLIGALVALSFMGCPTAHDQSYPSYALPVRTDLTSTTNTDAIQVTAVASALAYSTYDVTMTGLVADIGKKFVVAGASIGSTAATIGDNWNVTAASVTDTGLVGTVDATGTFHIVFYGNSPSWASDSSAQFKICRYDDASWAAVFANAGGNNLSVPNTAGASKFVVTINVDPNKL
jgi:hypothetical protein